MAYSGDEPPNKGLALHLEPMDDIHDMFRDMILKIKADFVAMAKDGAICPRIATICSGTESPIEALKAIEKAAINAGFGAGVKAVHVFSAEIEPFKQAYIRRNFNVPIIFRDVVELGFPGNDEA